MKYFLALYFLTITNSYKLGQKQRGPEDDLIDLDAIGIEPTPPPPTSVTQKELENVEIDAGEQVEQSISGIAADISEKGKDKQEVKPKEQPKPATPKAEPKPEPKVEAKPVVVVEQKVAEPAAPKDSLKSILAETDMFSLYGDFITRKDGLGHLLLSDVNDLLQKVAKDFPDVARVGSMGQSMQGRDMNYLELDVPSETKDKPAILMTGATHARELISTSLNLYEMLKLIKRGLVDKEDKYIKMLQQNRYYFLPILNVDGVAYIEQNWEQTHKIDPKRKNMDAQTGACKSATQSLVDMGVDLNRNFEVDFGQIDDIVQYQSDSWADESKGRQKLANNDPCTYNYAGPKAFSEPETQNFKKFLTEKKDELAFVINVHSNGNAFIYPFNGRQKNDIEVRRPGILGIFTQIAEKAPFPQGTMKGTSKEVMGIAIGGDQDDWTLDALGVPSVTAEVGYVGQFIDEWQVKDVSTANDIMMEQSPWVEYVFQNLPEFHKIVTDGQNLKKK